MRKRVDDRPHLTPALSPKERIPPNHISCFWPLNPSRHNPLIINFVVVGFMGREKRFERPDSTRGLLAASPCRDHSLSRSRIHPMLPHSSSRSRRLSLSRAGEGWSEGGRSSHTQHKTGVNFLFKILLVALLVEGAVFTAFSAFPGSSTPSDPQVISTDRLPGVALAQGISELTGVADDPGRHSRTRFALRNAEP